MYALNNRTWFEGREQCFETSMYKFVNSLLFHLCATGVTQNNCNAVKVDSPYTLGTQVLWTD